MQTFPVETRARLMVIAAEQARGDSYFLIRERVESTVDPEDVNRALTFVRLEANKIEDTLYEVA